MDEQTINMLYYIIGIILGGCVGVCAMIVIYKLKYDIADEVSTDESEKAPEDKIEQIKLSKEKLLYIDETIQMCIKMEFFNLTILNKTVALKDADVYVSDICKMAYNALKPKIFLDNDCMYTETCMIKFLVFRTKELVIDALKSPYAD